MEMTIINWTEVERIVETSFPEEYEMVTHKQIKAIEQKISDGKPPYVQQQQTGGMHIDFGAAINIVAELMLAASIIYAWYNYARPAKEEMTYDNFLNTWDEIPELQVFFKTLLTQEVLRLLERLFDQIIDALHYL